ncbi:glycosyltransferase [Actinopolyspora mortivallis]|uniref:glycosyltransferase n=1 Tax=Actinopolyspora mortivallis TaxID=33906 RepID=UPI0003763323|nr:glycosyltransferase [Actinopolyspora mortivallis]
MAVFRAAAQSAARARPRTEPVLAIVVCRRGAEQLAEVLAALEELTVRPRHVLAVDLGAGIEESSSGEGPPHGVVTPEADTGSGAAVNRALELAERRWGDPGSWVWLLDDDTLPEPECLRTLLHVADTDSSAAALGPLALDADDPRFVVDAALSMDTSGRVRTGTAEFEIDPSLRNTGDGAEEPLQVSEVLAVPASGALLRREVFEELGGFDEELSSGGSEVDLGWRINATGHVVLSVPAARVRRPDRDRSRPLRGTVVEDGAGPADRRADELLVYLANTGPRAYRTALLRLPLTAVLLVLGCVLSGRRARARAEVVAVGRLMRGGLRVRAAREGHGRSGAAHDVRELLIGRTARLRAALVTGYARLVRRRVRRDTTLGLPETRGGRPVDRTGHDLPRHGPDALPVGALGTGGSRRRSAVGLRKPNGSVVVSLPEATATAEEDEQRPSPRPRGREEAGEPAQDLLLVPVSRARVARELLLSPPLVLVVGLTLFSLAVHGLVAEVSRFGLDPHGGRLLPVPDLEGTWSTYLAAWHPVHGGTAAPASPALLVLGLLGGVLAPFGGPPTALALLLLLQVPLAGVAAYHAGGILPASRAARAVVAAAYALLPVGMLATSQGRIDVVLAHVMLPPLLVGIGSVVGALPARTRGGPNWLGTTCRLVLGLALLAAFSPGTYVLLVLVAVVGFVSPAAVPTGPLRRTGGFAALVLLPVACLLPWPGVWLSEPGILLHGTGAPMSGTASGTPPWGSPPDVAALGGAGLVLLVAALFAGVYARDRLVLPGVLLVLLGGGAALLVVSLRLPPVSGGSPVPGWPGGPLLVVSCGLLWIVLAAVAGAERPPLSPSLRRVTATAVVLSVLLLAAGAAAVGRTGPLRMSGGDTSSVAGFTADGYWMRLRPGQVPVLSPRRQPEFGTASLPPAEGAVSALERIQRDLLSERAERVRSGVVAAAARGTGRIVLPQRRASPFGELAGDLVEDLGHADGLGRVFRVEFPHTRVALLGPAQATEAREGAPPRPQSRPIRVRAELPHVTVRFSRGAPGRVLLLAAQREPGWWARVDGERVGLATGWGGQLAVPLPEKAGEVTIGYTGVPRTTLLTVQAAALLFTVIGALSRRSRRPGTRHRW